MGKILGLLLCLSFLFLTGLTLSEPEELCAEDVIEATRTKLKTWAKANGIDIPSKLYDPTTPPNANDKPEKYDFIIVGIGSSGSVLANRLSKNPAWKILALEAGDEPEFLTEVPAFTPLLQLTHHNWGYVTEKQPNISLGFENQKLHWPRGKGLGGSSLINYMSYTRTNKIDHDDWARLGNDGWAYEDVLPYFEAAENSNLVIEEVQDRIKCTELFVEAAKEIGYQQVEVSMQNQIGVNFYRTNTQKGRRFSAEKAYVRPIRTRENLTIRLNSHATKILIDEETKSAIGVQYVHKGKTFRAEVGKEVILSAGSIGSPHVLMVSGIGPRENLEAQGIKVVQELPVGQKLFDHMVFLGLTFTFNQSITFNMEQAMDPKSFEQLFHEGTGPLRLLSESLAFIKTEPSVDDRPNLELIVLPTDFSADKGMVSKRISRLIDQIYDEVYKTLEEGNNKWAWHIYPVVLRPKSFGYLELQSNDPFIYPKIYAGYFSDPDGHDLRVLRDGIREAIRIGENRVMREYGSELVRTKLPGCKMLDFDSDGYWECAIRHMTSTLYHPMATCKMGPRGDPEAIVDHRLRVHNVKNLRVADASVIPIPLTGHINSAAYMIGEKASAMIIDDWS